MIEREIEIDPSIQKKGRPLPVYFGLLAAVMKGGKKRNWEFLTKSTYVDVEVLVPVNLFLFTEDGIGKDGVELDNILLVLLFRAWRGSFDYL